MVHSKVNDENKSVHILLIDDEVELLSLIAETLVDLGYTPTATTDGREALRFFQEQPNKYKVIISDNNMPLLSGGEIAAAARKIRADIPVILISGSNEQDVLAQSPVPVEVLSKPFDNFELDTLIRKLNT